MLEELQFLIDAIRKPGSRFDTLEYAMNQKRQCEHRGDKQGADLWLKIARLAAVCCT